MRSFCKPLIPLNAAKVQRNRQVAKLLPYFLLYLATICCQMIQIWLQTTQHFLQEIARRVDDLEIDGLIFHRLDIRIKKPALCLLSFKRVARGR